MLLSNTLFFVIGLVLLVKGSDFFVKSAATIAKKLGVSEFVIGLTLVAVGTSIPELVSSVAASMKHQSGIVMGNFVGSNIANIGLIIGLAAAIAIIKTNEEMLKRDGYIMLFAALSFYFFILDKNISIIETIIFLLLYFVYIMFLFEEKPKFKGKYHFREFIRYFFEFKYIAAAGNRIISYQKEVKNKKRWLYCFGRLFAGCSRRLRNGPEPRFADWRRSADFFGTCSKGFRSHSNFSKVE